jgi:alkylation response protein AidB-like acyl-CoA dehydrogenase
MYALKQLVKRSGIDIAQSGAMAKLFASQTAMDTTIEAVQIHGGNGYVAEYHVERMMRDAKITQYRTSNTTHCNFENFSF